MKILRSFASNVCSWVMAIGYLLFLFAVGYLMLAWETLTALCKRNGGKDRVAALPAPYATSAAADTPIQTSRLPAMTTTPAASKPTNHGKALTMTYNPTSVDERPAVCKVIRFPVERTRRPAPLTTSDRLVSARLLFFPISRIVRRPSFGTDTNRPRN